MVKREFKELETGYIDPNGIFYPCGYMEHLSVADEILKELYGIPERKTDPEDLLMQKGWLSIHRTEFLVHEWLFGWKGHLTPEQIKVIRPAVEEEKEWISDLSLFYLEQEFERS